MVHSSTNKPLVTLTMSLYEAERFIENTLLSALNQTYPNIEYVIVDDKGSDNSITILKNVIEKHERGKAVRIIDHKYNKGNGAARNTGIKEAHGEYIMFMDDDDILLPNAVECLVQYMLEYPVDFIAAGYEQRLFSSGELLTQYKYKPTIISKPEKLSVANLRYVQKYRMIVAPWSKIYSLKFLLDNNIYCIPNAHAEDPAFFFQIICKAKTCRFVQEVLYIWQIHESQSVSRSTQDKDCFKKYIESYIATKNFCLDVAARYSKFREYGALLYGIYTVAYLHSSMLIRAKILSMEEERQYLNDLLKYDGFKAVLHLKTKRQQNILFYIIGLCPYFVKKNIIRLLYKIR